MHTAQSRIVDRPELRIAVRSAISPFARSTLKVASTSALWGLLAVNVVAVSRASRAHDGQLGLPATGSTPATRAEAAIGKKLFFEKRLSADGTISCATCHVPSKAFTDGLPVAKGINAQMGTRNTPSLWNVAFGSAQFWDGRRGSLEKQAGDPLLNPREHGLTDFSAVLLVIRGDRTYRRDFRRAFAVAQDAITQDLVVRAIASFERTLIAGDSPFDRYLFGGDQNALSDSAVRGLELFRGRAQCVSCHSIGEQSALLTDGLYHRLSVGVMPAEGRLAAPTTKVIDTLPSQVDRLIGEDPEVSALGRFVVTKRPSDIGRFKTPSLRNVAVTGPYMHDGSVNTLADAIDTEVYYRGFEANRPLILTPIEKMDLIEFLNSLTSPSALSTTS